MAWKGKEKVDNGMAEGQTPRGRRYTAREKGKAKAIDTDDIMATLAESGERDVKDVVGIFTVRSRAKGQFFPHLLAAVSRHGDDAIGGILFNPKWPFLTPLKIISARRFRKEAYCFLYYLVDSYNMAFSFNLHKLKKILMKCMENKLFYRYLVKFFELFKPLQYWLDDVVHRLAVHEKESGHFGLLVLGRKYMGFTEREITFDWINFGMFDLFYYLQYDDCKYLKFKNEMIDINGLDTMSELDLLLENPFYSEHNYPESYERQMALANAMRYTGKWYFDEEYMKHIVEDSADEEDSSNSDASEEI